jgi:hypothetical protein
MNRQTDKAETSADANLNRETFDANRKAIYLSLVRAEVAKAKNRLGAEYGSSRAYFSAAKANATKKFFALEAAVQS